MGEKVGAAVGEIVVVREEEGEGVWHSVPRSVP
jgi:hypothetical protein